MAGVIDIDWGLASFSIGEQVCDDDLKAMGDNVMILESGKILLTGFIDFQYGKLNNDSRVHKAVLKCLHTHGIGYPYPMDTTKEKEKEKDKDKDLKEEGIQGEKQDPHAPASADELKTYEGATKFLKLHHAFERIADMAIHNALKEFSAYKEHWPKFLRQYQTDNAGAELKYAPCRDLRIAFHRFIKFSNIPSPYQSL